MDIEEGFVLLHGFRIVFHLEFHVGLKKDETIYNCFNSSAIFCNMKLGLFFIYERRKPQITSERLIHLFSLCIGIFGNVILLKSNKYLLDDSRC